MNETAAQQASRLFTLGKEIFDVIPAPYSTADAALFLHAFDNLSRGLAKKHSKVLVIEVGTLLGWSAAMFSKLLEYHTPGNSLVVTDDNLQGDPALKGDWGLPEYVYKEVLNVEDRTKWEGQIHDNFKQLKCHNVQPYFLDGLGATFVEKVTAFYKNHFAEEPVVVFYIDGNHRDGFCLEAIQNIMQMIAPKEFIVILDDSNFPTTQRDIQRLHEYFTSKEVKFEPFLMSMVARFGGMAHLHEPFIEYMQNA